MGIELVENWDPFLDNFDSNQKDVYYTEEYVKLYQTENDKPVCFIYNQGENYLLFPV